MSAVAGLIGGSAPLSVTLNDQNVQRLNNPAGYSLKSNGTATTGTGSGLEAWLLTGSAARAECLAEVTAGSVSGTINSWLPLSSDNGWSSDSATMIVKIREVGTTTVLDQATITLEAEYGGGGGL